MILTKYYKVPEDILLNLLENRMELNALSNGDVDHQPWYGQAFDDYMREDPLLDKFCQHFDISEDKFDDIDFADFIFWKAQQKIKQFGVVN